MKFYEIIIKPKSVFATNLKGDTIFGNLCWCINNNIKPLGDLINNYKDNPFLVVSSAFISFKDEQNINNYILPRPQVPEEMLFSKDNDDEWVNTRKERQQKKYFVIKENTKELNIKKIEYKKLSDFIDNKECVVRENIQHNTINRKTFTTGKNQFAPWTIPVNNYNNKDFSLVIFVAVDESKFSKEELKKSFEILGTVGFGKKASIGYGKFDLVSFEESKLFNNLSKNTNYFYTLSPCVPKENEILEENSYFQPFTRFGKHGDIFAKGDTPFKKPVIMIDESALINLTNPLDNNYFIIGSYITNVSFVEKNTVVQGYSLCLPIEVEEK